MKEPKPWKRAVYIAEQCKAGKILCCFKQQSEEKGAEAVFYLEPGGFPVGHKSAENAISHALLVPQNDGLFGPEFSQTYVPRNAKGSHHAAAEKGMPGGMIAIRKSVPTEGMADKYLTGHWRYVMPDFDKPGNSIIESTFVSTRVPPTASPEERENERAESGRQSA